MNATQNEMWDKVVTAGEQVAYAYQEMVRATDELAMELGYHADHVLRQVLPKTLGERRDGERVLTWLNRHRDEIESHLLARQTRRDEAARREALLTKLNLTVAEQKLLGITGRQ